VAARPPPIPEPEVVVEALALVPALPQEADARTTDVKSTAEGASGTRERERMARMQRLDRWRRQARVAERGVEIVLSVALALNPS
jgi:hypothetical protein